MLNGVVQNPDERHRATLSFSPFPPLHDTVRRPLHDTVRRPFYDTARRHAARELPSGLVGESERPELSRSL
jgi:hypothetical protein